LALSPETVPALTKRVHARLLWLRGVAFTHLRPLRRPATARWKRSVTLPGSLSRNEIVVPTPTLAIRGSAGPSRQRLDDSLTPATSGAVASAVPPVEALTLSVTVAGAESDVSSLPV
jgi:hypothetical protein